MTRRSVSILATLLAVGMLTACGSTSPAPMDPSPTSTQSLATSTPTPTPTNVTVSVSEGNADLTCVVEGDTVLVDAAGKAKALVSGASTAPTVLIAPQVNDRICAMDELARQLVELGYRAIQVDVDVRPVASLVAVADWARDNGGGKIALLGGSRGATDVLAASPEISPDVVIALSPPTMFSGADAKAAMPQATAPTMILVGASDGRFTSQSKELAAAATTITVDLVVVDESGNHGFAFLMRDLPQRQQILDYLATYML